MPNLAVSNRLAVNYAVESAFGTTPTAGNNKALRITGETLNFTLKKDSSKEIRYDRAVADISTLDADAAGSLPFEFSYREYDDFIEAAFQGTWAAFGTAGIGATFVGSFAPTTITAGAATTGSSAFTTLQKGQWFKLNAPAQPDNGKWLRVSPSVAPTSTVITLDALTPLSGTGSSIAGCTIATSRLFNYTTQRSFSIEDQFTDISQYLTYRGMVLSKMMLDIKSGSFITGSFDFMGKDQVRNTGTQLPGSTTLSQTFDVLNGVTNIPAVYEGGAALTSTYIKNFTFNLDNSTRGQKAIGVLGNAGIASGTGKVTGKAEMYFADGAMYQKFLDNAQTSLMVQIKDAAGNGYVITLPKVRYTKGDITAGSLDQDVMVSLEYQAVLDPVTSYQCIIDRLGA